MRYLVVLMVAVIGCGPGTAQIQTARAAEYKVSAARMFEIAKAAAAENYKIDEEDPRKPAFATAPQFYSAEGARQSPGAGDVVTVRPGSVRLSLVVQITDAGLHRVNVTVTPHVLQIVVGSPKPRELVPGDPNMPPWVGGRVDALMVAIYERAKQYIEKP